MKNTIIILLCIFSWQLSAQDSEPTYRDTTNREFYHKEKSKPSRYRKVRTRYGLVDIGISAISTPTTYRLENGIDPFELRLLKSLNFNLHLIQQRVSLADRHMNLVYGLTIESHRYRFDNPVVLLEDTPEVQFEFFEDRKFKKNRLAYTYLTVPLMLNLKSNPKYPYRSFHLSAGGFAGLLLGANFKTKEKGNKEKVKDNYGLNTFRFGLRGEIGYGPFILYGTYALNNLFDKDKDNGYEVKPFAIGLIVWPF